MSPVDDLREAVPHEAPPAVPSVVAGVGVPSAASDASPSRDRLARIAAMISDAEQGVEVNRRPQLQGRNTGLIALGPRRRARPRRRAAVTVVDLAG